MTVWADSRARLGPGLGFRRCGKEKFTQRNFRFILGRASRPLTLSCSPYLFVRIIKGLREGGMEVRILKGLHPIRIRAELGTGSAEIGKRSGMIGLVPYYPKTYYHMITVPVKRKFRNVVST